MSATTADPRPMEAAPLHAARCGPGDGAPSSRMLGLLRYGDAVEPAPPVPHPLSPRFQQPFSHAVAAPRLLAGRHQDALADAWFTEGPLREGRCGSVHWRASRDWLFGAADLGAEAEADGGLEALAHRAYADLFATLRAHGQPPLLRLWNYLPRITDIDADHGHHGHHGGQDRYRQFNSGRQRAFLEAGQAAFDGAPAACALGLRGDGGLSLRFLAGHTTVRAVENPRQVSAYRYPAQYGPRAPTFSRAALARLGGGTLALLVSGTASIVGHQSLHAGDTPAQVDETLRNLHAVVDAARAQCSAAFSLADSAPVVYVRHADQAGAICAQLADALGADSRFMRQAVFLHAEVCRPELDVEIETFACAPGELHAR